MKTPFSLRQVIAGLAVVAIILIALFLVRSPSREKMPDASGTASTRSEKTGESLASSTAVSPAVGVAASSASPVTVQITPVAATSTANPPALTSASPSATPSRATVSAVSGEGARAGEIAGTARMIAAHAPLRVPEISDPDSESNRRILETMVRKAIRQPVPSARPPSISN